jgi:hypothetical protein
MRIPPLCFASQNRTVSSRFRGVPSEALVEGRHSEERHYRPPPLAPFEVSATGRLRVLIFVPALNLYRSLLSPSQSRAQASAWPPTCPALWACELQDLLRVGEGELPGQGSLETGFEEPLRACRLTSRLVHDKAGFAALEVGAGSIRADPARPPQAQTSCAQYSQQLAMLWFPRPLVPGSGHCHS